MDIKRKIKNFMAKALIVTVFVANVNFVFATNESDVTDASVSQNDSTSLQPYEPSISQSDNVADSAPTTETTPTPEVTPTPDTTPMPETPPVPEEDASVSNNDASVSQNDIMEEPFYQELVFENEEVLITVSAEEEGIIPEGATLNVVPILPDAVDTQQQYAEVEQELLEKAEGEEYEIAGFLAYDISFIDQDGNKIEPNGAVKVSMEYIKATIPEEVVDKVENEEVVDVDVTVMHLAEDANGEVKEVVDMAEATGDATENKVETLVVNDNQEIEKAEFVTESFSVFTITWTGFWGGEDRVVNVHVVDIYGMAIEALNLTEARTEKGANITAETVETVFENNGVNVADANLDTNSKKLYVIENGNATEVAAVSIDAQGTADEGWRCQPTGGGWRDWDPTDGDYTGDAVGSEVGATRDLYLVYDYLNKGTVYLEIVDETGTSLVGGNQYSVTIGQGYDKTIEQLEQILLGNAYNGNVFIENFNFEQDFANRALYDLVGFEVAGVTEQVIEETGRYISYNPVDGNYWHYNVPGDWVHWTGVEENGVRTTEISLVYEANNTVDVHVVDIDGNAIAGFEQPIPVTVLQGNDKSAADFVTALEDAGYNISDDYTLIGLHRDSYTTGVEGVSNRIETVSYNPATQNGADYPWHYLGFNTGLNYATWFVWYEPGQDNVAVTDPQVYLVYENTKDAKLETVATVDNDQYGITMRMIDFSDQAHKIPLDDNGGTMGGATYTGAIMYDIVQNRLVNGYPVSNGVDGGVAGASMAKLFNETDVDGDITATKYNDVDGLFRQDIYDNTGYFYYSGFDNYAYLNQTPITSDDAAQNGELRFDVYKQIGTPSDNPRYFFQRGNFMPFNDISATGISENRNWYDGDGNAISSELTSTDANGNVIDNPYYDERYNERLHITQGDNNYYFGMYLEASFYQPEDGKVTHNGVKEDMLYSFNGDDDLWLFVDDVLVLDIGGNHDAHSGEINFATGIVTWYDCENEDPPVRYQTSIYQMYVEALGAEAAAEYFDTSNPLGTIPGTDIPVYRYKDYSNHTMKMFYMERGAAASNLELKFNLATITDEIVEVEKTLEGNNADNSYYNNLEYSFMIGLRPKDSEESASYDYAALTQATIKNTTNVIEATDDNIFKIKPGQVAQFSIPANMEYKIVEVGIDPETYVDVESSEVVFTPQNGGESYETDALEHIDYIKVVNKVNTGDLTLTKKLNGTGDDSANAKFKFKVWVKDATGAYVPYKGDYYTEQSTSEGSDTPVAQAVINKYPANNTSHGATYDEANKQVTFWINDADEDFEDVWFMWYKEYGSYEEAEAAHIEEGGDFIVGLNMHSLSDIDLDYSFPEGVTLTKGRTVDVKEDTKAVLYYFLPNNSSPRKEYEHIIVIDDGSGDSGGEDTGSNNVLTTTDGVIELKAGETVTLKGLPNKTEYFIQEIELADEFADAVYSTDYTGEEPDNLPEGDGVYGVIAKDSTAAVTVTNAYKTTVNVEKVWENGDAPASVEILAGLYIQEGDTLTAVVDEEPITLKADNADANNWKGTFADIPMLPEGQSYVVRELVETDTEAEAEFTVVGTDGTKKYYMGVAPDETMTIDEVQYYVSYSQDGDATKDTQLSAIITNTKVDPWRIVKKSDSKDKDGNFTNLALFGAKFTLTADTGENTTIYYGESGVDGVLKWYTSQTPEIDTEVERIPDGTYTLQETKAPVGYALSTETWTIVVEKGNVTITKPGTTEGSAPVVVESTDDENGVLTFTYYNTALYELPSTGGIGIFWFAGVGLLLLFAAIMLNYKSRHAELPI